MDFREFIQAINDTAQSHPMSDAGLWTLILHGSVGTARDSLEMFKSSGKTPQQAVEAAQVAFRSKMTPAEAEIEIQKMYVRPNHATLTQNLIELFHLSRRAAQRFAYDKTAEVELTLNELFSRVLPFIAGMHGEKEVEELVKTFFVYARQNQDKELLDLFFHFCNMSATKFSEQVLPIYKTPFKSNSGQASHYGQTSQASTGQNQHGGKQNRGRSNYRNDRRTNE